MSTIPSPDSERLTKLIETLSSSDSDTREAAAIEVLNEAGASLKSTNLRGDSQIPEVPP